MVGLSHRFYRDDRDLDRMLAFVSTAATRDGVAAGHLHQGGDIVWRLFQNLTIDPTTAVRLFEDDAGALVGFVWLHPPQAFELHVLPDSPGRDALLAEMVSWAESRLGPTKAFHVEVPAPQEWLRAALAGRGYRDTGAADYVLNHRVVRDPLPAPVLPDGATIRPVRLDDPAEVEARVALHREVWHPSRFTVDGYARLRTKPVYRPDLDLVAVTPQGDLASYCIVWWDPATRTGEFEPVGTSERFRGRGYGTALMRDGLRRLRSLGAEQAIVLSATREESKPSRRLYASAGFDVAFRYETWERRPVR
jgi:mycothiol synthase